MLKSCYQLCDGRKIIFTWEYLNVCMNIPNIHWWVVLTLWKIRTKKAYTFEKYIFSGEGYGSMISSIILLLNIPCFNHPEDCCSIHLCDVILMVAISMCYSRIRINIDHGWESEDCCVCNFNSFGNCSLEEAQNWTFAPAGGIVFINQIARRALKFWMQKALIERVETSFYVVS